MRKFLAHDAATGELRLVYTDLWDGQHERTEFRVTGGRGGKVLRNQPERDGAGVFGTVPGLFIKSPHGTPIAVWTQETAVGPTERQPCRRAASKSGRAKCALCATEEAAAHGS